MLTKVAFVNLGGLKQYIPVSEVNGVVYIYFWGNTFERKKRLIYVLTCTIVNPNGTGLQHGRMIYTDVYAR